MSEHGSFALRWVLALAFSQQSLNLGWVQPRFLPRSAENFIQFMTGNGVFEKFQSGFRVGHGTEDCPPLNGLLLATGHSSILILLDITAAFDAVDC